MGKINFHSKDQNLLTPRTTTDFNNDRVIQCNLRGQCSRKMKDQLEANKKFTKISKGEDVVGLLKLIKVLSHQFAVNRSLEELLNVETFKMMAYQQGEDDSVADHSSWYFMSLESGKRLHRYKWTVLPATEEVINRVHELGKSKISPKYQTLLFLVGKVTQLVLTSLMKLQPKILK